MNLVKRAFYYTFVSGIKAYQRLFLDLRVWGRETIPKGPKIYVSNHITSTDPLWFLPVPTEPTHIIIGPAYNSPVLGKLLDAFEQINAMSQQGETVVAEAVKYLKKGEPVAVAPEGDIQEPFRLGRYYPGVAKIYRLARVPIIPIAVVAPKRCMREIPSLVNVIDGRVYRMVVVVRGTYCINVGQPWMPKCQEMSDARQTMYITRGLRERIEALLGDIRRNKYWLSP